MGPRVNVFLKVLLLELFIHSMNHVLITMKIERDADTPNVVKYFLK